MYVCVCVYISKKSYMFYIVCSFLRFLLNSFPYCPQNANVSQTLFDLFSSFLEIFHTLFM